MTILRHFLDLKELGTTTFHLQTNTNSQVELYTRTLAARLRHQVFEDQKDWDSFVQLLTYVYMLQTNRGTGTSLFHVIQTLEQPSAATFEWVEGLANEVQGDVPPQHMTPRLLLRTEVMKTAVSCRLSTAKQCYYHDFDTHVRRGNNIQNMVLIVRGLPPTSCDGVNLGRWNGDSPIEPIFMSNIWEEQRAQCSIANSNNRGSWRTEINLHRSSHAFFHAIAGDQQPYKTMQAIQPLHESQSYGVLLNIWKKQKRRFHRTKWVHGKSPRVSCGFVTRRKLGFKIERSWPKVKFPWTTAPRPCTLYQMI